MMNGSYPLIFQVRRRARIRPQSALYDGLTIALARENRGDFRCQSCSRAGRFRKLTKKTSENIH